ncbi:MULTISPECIES: phosphonate ABC transporter substrate-binding protein [Halomonas]|uniref:phosphonate ABC transporter substrate-binding protein n=1 Tax=Halomonas TaxID=2745 RepID=UPI001A8E31F7|nr:MULTISPECIES: phosphonate ABC transporter substrate-binding protein [Halomonas]MBN8413994.1 phosphonate ABC transporter substrate-binding protein [Halomonas litopenaei]MBY5926803.1 phosphonate ABC transporter substrate-binding protein [Halomonas sp. DP4Y7-2]MBY5930252.1 phosphonate ABC transporter substrate-binding protein [Halomonas sp. DP8Y7-3]MBY5970243.1 phosphonate ABC transporter substrate-binding protein [Halomonas denitrificans]MBY5985865.1 phosphonate ABC transporter substrate-bind
MLFANVRRLSLPLMAGLGLAAVTQLAAADTLKFGIISTEASQNLAPLWDPFLEDMSEQVGMEVEPFFATDYAAVIQAMRFGQIDLAWYGNKAAMEAVDRAGGEIFAQTVAADGSPGYWSLMIAHQDSDLHDVDDVLSNASDLVFGNGDPNSTSGFLVPGYYVFAKNGVDAATAFKRTLNSSHETNALAVANKQVDVATFNTEGMQRLEVTAPDKAEQLRVIWKSPLIPSDPLVWRSDLDEATKDTLREFFMSYGDDADEQAILEPLQWAEFVASSNDQLLPIRQLALFKERSEVAKDDSLSEGDREARLAEIDGQLDDLDTRMKAIQAAEAMPEDAAANAG